QAVGEHLPRARIVLDDKYPRAVDALGHDPAADLALGQPEARGERERAALALPAPHPDAAVHHLDEPPADGEAAARPAVLAGRRSVRLGEGLEQAGDLLGRHADARVADLELEYRVAAAALAHGRLHPDLPALGELDRVVHELGERLPEAQRVPREPSWNVRADVEEKLQPLVEDPLGDHGR